MGYNRLTNLLLTSWDIQVTYTYYFKLQVLRDFHKYIHLELQNPPVLNGCFTWIAPNHCMKNGGGSPNIHLELVGFQVYIYTHVYIPA